LEGLRVQGAIGSSLDAEVEISCTAANFARASALGGELRFFLITSEAQVVQVTAPPEGSVAAGEGVWLRVAPSGKAKCIRCWHHRPDVGAVAGHPEICARCASNVDGPGETRAYA
ncbi:MAG: zinc finger domain-containing protein, partial [Steroidobacteraceae bacterium]